MTPTLKYIPTSQLQEEMEMRRDELHQREQSRRREESEAMIGKVFVYRNNCYSCPENPDDYWDIYHLITGVDEDGYPVGVSIQDDKQGMIKINTGPIHYRLGDEQPIEKWNEFATKKLAKIQSLIYSQTQ